MTVAILAAGDYPRKAYPRYLLEQSDALVCCDSALEQALRHGLKADAVVGDMDSINPSARKAFGGEFVQVDEQDFNDLTKAMRYVLNRWPDVSEINIFGATGKHEAHTIGNLSLLMEYEAWWNFWQRDVRVQIVSDYCTAFAIGDSCSLDIGEGRKISFFSCDSSLRIASSGLQWPLDNFEFGNWWKATLNRSNSDRITLQMNHPAPVLVILE